MLKFLVVSCLGRPSVSRKTHTRFNARNAFIILFFFVFSWLVTDTFQAICEPLKKGAHNKYGEKFTIGECGWYVWLVSCTFLGSICLRDNPTASTLPTRRLLNANSEGPGKCSMSSITHHEPFHSLPVFGSATEPPGPTTEVLLSRQGPLLKCY